MYNCKIVCKYANSQDIIKKVNEIMTSIQNYYNEINRIKEGNLNNDDNLEILAIRLKIQELSNIKNKLTKEHNIEISETYTV